MGRTSVIAGLVGCVAFAAGVVAGMGIGGDGAPKETTEIVRTTTMVVAPSDPAETPPRVTKPRPQPPREATPSPQDAELTRRLVAEPPPAVPQGEGRITGTVKREDGSPVAGIAIEATANAASSRRNWWDAPAQEDVETRARRFVADERLREVSRRVAVTGPDGRYELTGLGDGTYQLRTYLPDWNLMAPNQERAWKARAGDVIDFTALMQALVPLRVVLPDGSAPEQASIQFQRGNMGEGAQWTPNETVARVSPGLAKVWATSGEASEWKSDVVEAEIPHHGAKEIVLTLRGRAGVTGQIRFAPGWDLLHGVRVGIRRAGTQADAATRDAAGPDAVWPHQHNDFRYAYFDVAPGKWLLSVRIGGAREPVLEVPVEITSSLVRRDLDVPPPDRSKFVEVIALGPDGSPVREATFEVERRSGRRTSSQSAQGIRRPEGSWWIAANFDDDAPADAEYTVTVKCPEFGEAVTPYKPGPAATAQVRFQVPATVTAVVAGYSGSGLEGMLTVGLERVRGPEERPSRSWRGTGVSADGSVKLDPTAPGDYDVLLLLNEGHGAARPISRTRVALPAGEEVALRLEIPELFTLTVDFGESGAKSRIECRPADQPRGGFGTSVQATADAAGKAVLPRLTRGTWILRKDRDERRVDVNSDTTLRW